MKNFLLVLLLVILYGCGGGGGQDNSSVNPPPNSPTTPITTPVDNVVFIEPAIIPEGKLRLARLDYRYDTPINQLNKHGYQTTSFESVRPMIDTMKKIGFNGVIVTLQVPINKDTGLVSFYDVPNSDKRLPKDLWKVVDYIKSKEMQVWLSLGPVDSVNDVLLKPNLNNYSAQTLFYNIAEFQKSIAIIAEQHKVNGLFIGECFFGYEHGIYIEQWKKLISTIKSVFTGKLSYATCIVNDTAIWHHVDYATINANSVLSQTPIYDLKEIVKLYFNTVHHGNEIELIKNWHYKYNKKFILITSPTIADLGVAYIPENFWDNVIIGSSATSVLDIKPNKEMQLLKIAAFNEVINKYIPEIATGLGFAEFTPWLTNVPNDDIKGAFYHYVCCGIDLTNNIEAQQKINFYFSKPWGFYTVQ